MRNTKQLFKTFGILVCLTTIVFSAGCGRWKGGSRADWEAALKDKDPMKRAEATVALGTMGADGIPGLTEALSDESPLVRRKAAESLQSSGPEAISAIDGLIALLQDQDLGVQEAAAETLGAIGPAADKALPALQKALAGAIQKREPGLKQKIQEAIQLIQNQSSA
ncbi:MAG: HEAT repeat domain-containing protein [Planctomycetia bacterium]